MTGLRLLFFILFLAIVSACDVFAAGITLKSGKTLEGVIIEKTAEQVVLDMDGIVIPVPVDKIDSITGDAAAGATPGEPAPDDSSLPRMVIQRGHTFDTSSLAVSPDGKKLITGSYDSTIGIWNLEHGELLRRIHAHQAQVGSVALSDDGSTILSGSWDGAIRTWDINTGERLLSFHVPADNDGYTPAVMFVDFVPGMNLIVAVATHDRHSAATHRISLIHTFDAATGEQVGEVLEFDAMISSSRLSPDGRTIALGMQNGQIKLRDIESGVTVYTLDGHSGDVFSLAYSPGGAAIVAGDREGNLSVWDTETLEMKRMLKGHESAINTIEFAHDGQGFYTGSWDKALKYWDIETFESVSRPESHNGWLSDIALSPDGRTIFTSGSDSDINLWAAGSLEKINVFGDNARLIRTTVFSPGGGRLAWAGWDNKIRLWNLDNGMPAGILKGHTWQVFQIAFSNDGKRLSSCARDGTIRVWDVDNLEQLHVFKEEIDYYCDVKFSTDAGFLITSSDLKGAKLWNLDTGEIDTVIQDKKKFLYSLDVSHDGGMVAMGSDHSSAILRNLMTNEHIHTFKGIIRQVIDVEFSPGGKLLAISGMGKNNNDGAIEIWDIASRKALQRFSAHVSSVKSISFSPDGARLVSCSWDHTVKIWDVKTGGMLHSLEGGGLASLESCDFSYDGEYVMAGGWDATVNIWNSRSGEKLLSLVGFVDENWFVADAAGRFDCSGCARGASDTGKKYIRWRIGNTLYKPEQFFDHFFEPGVFLDVMRLGRVPAIDGMETLLAEVPPEVEIVWPLETQTKRDEIKVKVRVRDMGGGVENVRLLSHGRPIGGAPRAASEPGGDGWRNLEFLIPLTPGRNRIVALASSRSGVDSREADVTVTSLREKTKPPRMFLLTVGVNEYENSAYNLHLATVDADAIAKALSEKSGSLFSEVVAFSLRDSSATVDELRAAIDEIMAAAGPDDMVVIYLSGHGSTAGGGWYFLTHEIRFTDEEYLRENAFSHRELKAFLKRLPARKVVLMIDACQSGAMALAMTRGLEKERIMREFARSTGTFVLSAATDAQAAIELQELGHGVFTYVLLEGLGGKADINNSGTVEIRELEIYAAGKVPEYTEKYYGARQDPFTWSVVGGGGMGGMGPPLVILE